MKLTIIGTGYVGLVTGACLAELGNQVWCVDIDAGKIERLRGGEIPIYEPGLEELVRGNLAASRLRFTTELPEALDETDVHFIAVGTPPGEDGSADLQHVLAAARAIGRHLKRPAVIVNKSTVPVGTAERVRATVQEELTRRGLAIEFDVVSNPEFLREGSAIEDFMQPDRIVLGCDGPRARERLSELYAPFSRDRECLLFMGVRDAELTKYAANAMLATRISFINEIAGLCERLGADVDHVRRGIGSDRRIGYAFINPGCGYGGSCFPKDVKALIHMAGAAGFDPALLRAVEARNNAQKQVLFEKLVRRFGPDLTGVHIAIWGLAFKPGTDDLREASALVLLSALYSAGAQIRVHDPVAISAARRLLPDEWQRSGRLRFVDDPYEAPSGADALVLVTEWPHYRNPDFERLRTLMRQPVILDGRNLYDPQQLHQHGFEYEGIGRAGGPSCHA
jgi:UDPglucose 6-dehydrogenase